VHGGTNAVVAGSKRAALYVFSTLNRFFLGLKTPDFYRVELLLIP
jgi:hypothetical protein